jgi:hypothetical protein
MTHTRIQDWDRHCSQSDSAGMRMTDCRDDSGSKMNASLVVTASDDMHTVAGEALLWMIPSNG